MLCAAAPASLLAVSPLKPVSGSIGGSVTDGTGVPQMGATVLLFNRYDRLCQKVLTGEGGTFEFDHLLPGAYMVRVTLSSFLPAVRKDILVQPGVRSLLNVSLATLFSSVELVYPPPEKRAVMTDEWKWVLRSASSTRPVLRFTPDSHLEAPAPRTSSLAAAFRDTHGLVKVSAGDGGRVSAAGNESDLGTAFALATSLFGNHQLAVAGNIGFGAQSGMPSAGFRTSYSRDMGAGSPEVSLTVRQLFAPGRMEHALVSRPGAEMGMPALRTMSVAFSDASQLSDTLRLEYGFSLDSVTFLDRLNYFSPYGRLSFTPTEFDSFELTYTSGAARPGLATGMTGPEADLQSEISALAIFPKVSLLKSRARVQRGEDFEIGYRRKAGSRTYRLAAYREAISNAALSMVGAPVQYASGDILPDLFSDSHVFNAGQFSTSGFTASVTQNFGENLNVTMMYGSGGVLIPEEQDLQSNNPDELRSLIRVRRRHSMTARASGTSPWTGTQFVAGYQWIDRRSATPGHIYSTQGTRADVGLNVFVRQPIPHFGLFSGRVEAVADLRNLLAQGYLPVSFTDGRRLLLVHSPRSFRGGLSFIF
ncbi:MAG: TonB-dependent receptor [Bryobacterales bacterium]|nr:TonB-dependent receptor [Bryobacterales bacterium]